MVKKILLSISRLINQHYGVTKLCIDDNIQFSGHIYKITAITQDHNGADESIVIKGESIFYSKFIQRWRLSNED